MPSTTQRKNTETIDAPFTNKDLTLKRQEYFFEIPQALKAVVDPILVDKRDMPMIHLLFNICVTTVPSAILLYCSNITGWLHLWGLAHFALSMALYLPRFILCMHYSSHRHLFSKNSWMLNNLQTVVLAPIFGIPSGMYYIHHVIMHHREGNVFPDDWSSTMMYQRDNFLHFLHYWAKFFFTTYFYLPVYAVRKKLWQLAVTSTTVCFTYFFLVSIAYKFHATATMYVFILPHILTSFALMFGNWSQHMFLDPKQPESPYGCTFNAMNALDNAWTFNDGYHIVHHVRPGLHWTEMPQDFMKHMRRYSEEDCLVFDGLGFFDVGLMVMLGKLDKLAEHCVQWGFLGGPQRNTEETIAMFKARLAPMTPEKMKAKAQ